MRPTLVLNENLINEVKVLTGSKTRGAKNDSDYQLLKNALLALPQIPLDKTVIKTLQPSF